MSHRLTCYSSSANQSRSGLGMRKEYELTRRQLDTLNRLPEEEGFGWRFWEAIGVELGIDHKSIMPSLKGRRFFSALPAGHGKHWCYPYKLKCSKPVPAEVVV